MVGADERELHSWQNNQLSRRVSKAAGTRSTVSLRKPIFAIGFERAGYTVQREKEREIKDLRLLYSNSWKSFSYGQPPPSLSLQFSGPQFERSRAIRPFDQGN